MSSDRELREMLKYAEASRGWPLDRRFWNRRIIRIKEEIRKRGMKP